MATAISRIGSVGELSVFDKLSLERIDVLTEQEDKVLNLDYWLKPNVRHPQFYQDFFHSVVPAIRESYLSLKRRGVSFDIVAIVEDKESRFLLIQLVFCLLRIHQFSSWLQEYTLFWTNNCQQNSAADFDASATTVGDLETFSKLDELVNGEKDTRVNMILLILKEILAKMGIYPRISERDMRRVDSPSAELMCLVEAGVSRSRSVNRKNRLRLESLVKGEDYNPLLASDKIAELQRCLDCSTRYINAQGGEMVRSKFKNLMEIIYWYACL